MTSVSLVLPKCSRDRILMYFLFSPVELDEADIAAASSVSAAAAASSSSAKEAKKSALMASMSAALASRSAQGHVPGPYTKKDGNAFAAAATT